MIKIQSIFSIFIIWTEWWCKAWILMQGIHIKVEKILNLRNQLFQLQLKDFCNVKVRNVQAMYNRSLHEDLYKFCWKYQRIQNPFYYTYIFVFCFIEKFFNLSSSQAICTSQSSEHIVCTLQSSLQIQNVLNMPDLLFKGITYIQYLH